MWTRQIDIQMCKPTMSGLLQICKCPDIPYISRYTQICKCPNKFAIAGPSDIYKYWDMCCIECKWIVWSENNTSCFIMTTIYPTI